MQPTVEIRTVMLSIYLIPTYFLLLSRRQQVQVTIIDNTASTSVADVSMVEMVPMTMENADDVHHVNVSIFSADAETPSSSLIKDDSEA